MAVTRRSRIRGCLLGGAIGDALGAPVEFDSVDQIQRAHGRVGITGFLPSGYGGPGLVTDDTQLTLFTAEALLDGGDLREALHAAYRRWLITQEAETPPASATGLAARPWLYAVRAPGGACLSGLRARRRGTLDRPVNPDSKGCGTVMRAAPFGLSASLFSVKDVIDAAFAGSALTHGHPTAHHASAALALLVRSLIAGKDLIEAVPEVLAILRTRPGHDETVQALARAVCAAEAGEPSTAALAGLGEGWVAEEALAMSVYCALAHPGPGEVRDALLLAVNHGGDSDSTGAITGNLVGARHGEQALPIEWAEAVEGRDDVLALADRLADVAGVLPLQPATPKAVDRYGQLSRLRGLLLGLALGDALTRVDQPVPGVLLGTSTTQLACATADGVIRALVRADHRGIGPVPEPIWLAYRRWGTAQGIDQLAAVPLDGWLYRVAGIAKRRGDAPAMVAALQATAGQPRTGPSTSRGHHAITRVLPLACHVRGRSWVEDVAGWTHGNRNAQKAALEAVTLASLLIDGRPIQRIPRSCFLSDLTGPLGLLAPDHTAVSALRGGAALASACPGPEAILVSLRSALSVPGSAEGVGPVAGALLGARFGVEALPIEEVARLELGWAVDVLARDLVAQLFDSPGGHAYTEAADPHWRTRYPA